MSNPSHGHGGHSRTSWLLPLAAAFLTACAQPAAVDAGRADIQQLHKSLRIWEGMRRETAGHYRYTVVWRSAFGFGHRTTVEGRGATVVRRTFETWDLPAPGSSGQEKLRKRWEEGPDQIGINGQGDGAAPPHSLDRLYERCAEVLGKPAAEGERQVLAFDDAGLLKACYRRNTHVADDAPMLGVPYMTLTML